MTSSQDASLTGRPPFLAFVSDGADIETLRAFASGHGWDAGSIHQGDIGTAAQFLKENPSPVLLLVEIPSAAEAPALLDALANVCDPDTKVITVGNINEYSFYCWLMEIGVFNYLLRPLAQEALESAYAKSSERLSAAGKHEKIPGKVIAVLGTRGGVGATTVALNLAGIVADLTKKHVALVDLDPREGSISLSLDIEPSRGLREALEKPERVDSLFIERVMTKPLKNLSVLSAEEALDNYIQVHDDAATTLLRELRGKYDIVILDVPRFLSPFTTQFLKQAEATVLVTDLTLLSLRDGLRLGDLLRETLKMKPPFMVANRIGLAPKQEMTPVDFEKGINGKIMQRIAFAPDIFMPISSAIPAIKQKGNPAVASLYALAAQLVPEAKHKMPTRKNTTAFDLFKKMKKGA